MNFIKPSDLNFILLLIPYVTGAFTFHYTTKIWSAAFVFGLNMICSIALIYILNDIPFS